MKSVEGIILRKIPRKEADFVFDVYTKELGLASFQAKGVRKHSSKLKSGLDIFNFVDLFFVQSKYVPIITDFKVKNDFTRIKKNLRLLKLANFVSYTVTKIFEHGLSDQQSWENISSYFNYLNKEELKAEEVINSAYVFCYRILHSNGLQPELDRCVKCRKPVLEENLSISLVNGGIAHYSCINTKKIEPFRIANETINMPHGILTLASRMNSVGYSLSLGSKETEIFEDFKKLTEILFQYHFGININTLL